MWSRRNRTPAAESHPGRKESPRRKNWRETESSWKKRNAEEKKKQEERKEREKWKKLK